MHKQKYVRNKNKYNYQTDYDLELHWLVGFYGISTLVGYSMPNPFYTYSSNMISKHILLVTFLNKPELIFFAYS